MKRISPIAALLFAAVSPAFGQSPSKEPTVQTEDAVWIITKLEKEWCAAWVGKPDLAAIDRILAPEFTTTGPGVDPPETKSETEAYVKSGDIKITVCRSEELKVSVYGDMAIAQRLQTVEGQYKGKNFSRLERCTDIFVKRSGVWQMILSHETHGS